MDTLDILPTMSISEMRKYLSDHNITETAHSKEELIEQVSEVLLSQLAINDYMGQELSSQDVTPPRDTDTLDPRTLERIQQDKEYQECLDQDISNSVEELPDLVDELPNSVDELPFEELSLTELRQQRVNYYTR